LPEQAPTKNTLGVKNHPLSRIYFLDNLKQFARGRLGCEEFVLEEQSQRKGRQRTANLRIIGRAATPRCLQLLHKNRFGIGEPALGADEQPKLLEGTEGGRVGVTQELIEHRRGLAVQGFSLRQFGLVAQSRP